VGIDSETGNAVTFNQTHTEFLPTTQPLRSVSTNGKSYCGIIA
jgi:hypothetical protein